MNNDITNANMKPLAHKQRGTATEKIIWEQSVEKLLGPVVQSIASLTSSLVVKMLTVLVSTISNSQVFLLKKSE